MIRPESGPIPWKVRGREERERGERREERERGEGGERTSDCEQPNQCIFEL